LTALQVDEFLGTLNKLNIAVAPTAPTAFSPMFIAWLSRTGSHLTMRPTWSWPCAKDLPLATLDDELIAASKAAAVALL
jgi:hypothetical protein